MNRPDIAELAHEALRQDEAATPAPWILSVGPNGSAAGIRAANDTETVAMAASSHKWLKRFVKLNAPWIIAARTREPHLARAVIALQAALDDATRTWTFNDAQNHTHSWHDREDWYERHEVAREARRRAKGAPPQ